MITWFAKLLADSLWRYGALTLVYWLTLLLASTLLVGTDKYCSTELVKTFTTESESTKIANFTEFHGNGQFHERRPISRKMSRPWNRELGSSLLLTLMMMMILLVWQPIGWTTNKVHCKLQKKKKYKNIQLQCQLAEIYSLDVIVQTIRYQRISKFNIKYEVKTYVEYVKSCTSKLQFLHV